MGYKKRNLLWHEWANTMKRDNWLETERIKFYHNSFGTVHVQMVASIRRIKFEIYKWCQLDNYCNSTPFSFLISTFLLWKMYKCETIKQSSINCILIAVGTANVRGIRNAHAFMLFRNSVHSRRNFCNLIGICSKRWKADGAHEIWNRI